MNTKKNQPIKLIAFMKVRFIISLTCSMIIFFLLGNSALLPAIDKENNSDQKLISIGIFSLRNGVSSYQKQYQPWDLEREITTMLAQRLKLYSRFKLKIFSPNVSATLYQKFSKNKQGLHRQLIRYGEKNNYDLLLKGIIQYYGVSSTGVVSYTLGGWEHHEGVCNILLDVIDVKNQTVTNLKIEGKADRNWYGLTLLGGPGASDEWVEMEDPLQYYTNLTFGSEKFLESPIGRSTTKTIDSIATFVETNYIKDFLVLKQSNTVINNIVLQQNKIDNIKTYLQGKVVDVVDGENIYLNVGRVHRLQVGERLLVFDQGKQIKDPDSGKVIGNRETKVAILKIENVLADTLSKASVEEKHKNIPIKIGQKVRFYQP